MKLYNSHEVHSSKVSLVSVCYEVLRRQRLRRGFANEVGVKVYTKTDIVFFSFFKNIFLMKLCHLFVYHLYFFMKDVKCIETMLSFYFDLL